MASITPVRVTPLHLREHVGSLEIVGLVMSVHVAGITVLAAAPGHNHAVIGVALIMLGLGWSMATISGAALLIAAVPSEEQARTQGVAEMTMGIAGGAGGTVSGIVVGSVGYATLNVTGAVLAGAVLAALSMQRERHPLRSSTRTTTGPA